MKLNYIDDLTEEKGSSDIMPLKIVGNTILTQSKGSNKPSILFITSYPPRECGIATYSNDLIDALNRKFHNSFSIKVCALESEDEKYQYTGEVKYTLDTSDAEGYAELAGTINKDNSIKIVLLQHEFGFFNKRGEEFMQFLNMLTKPVVTVFHSVLPHPDELLRMKVLHIASVSSSIVVMTNNAAKVLMNDYGVMQKKITVIPHGTHLVSYSDKVLLKDKYGLKGKKVLSTFGLLSSGKSIETTLKALPPIIKSHPDVMFLIIGKTHPSIIRQEGEKYRSMLKAKVKELKLQDNVQFINKYVSLPTLLDYLQLTDIYVFTSKDPNQAVSGTFSYAISCGCAIISTPIPHVQEVLRDDAGIIIDFENEQQLSEAISRLLNDEQLRENISLNGLHRMASTAWENSAIAHARLFQKTAFMKKELSYTLPSINLNHVRKMTTDFGIIQFSNINHPDIESGYTLDDNARAMIALCKHYKLTRDEADIPYITLYFNFIKYCLQPEGYFLNYVDKQKKFTDQNSATNLADANGRAIWALGYLISIGDILPDKLLLNVNSIMRLALQRINTIHSTRAIGFLIKGLYYRNIKQKSHETTTLIISLAMKLVQMYTHESEKGWEWFENYFTYANGVLPEAVLCAYLETKESEFKDIAKESFDFLLSQTFNEDGIKVISNRGWMHKGEEVSHYGEQPIDVAYTILALSRFYEVFKEESYLKKMETAFSWFLGNNHLHQVIYNPTTGGCYDGLEEKHVNLNQGAESTLSYLLARLAVEKYFNTEQKIKLSAEENSKLNE